MIIYPRKEWLVGIMRELGICCPRLSVSVTGAATEAPLGSGNFGDSHPFPFLVSVGNVGGCLRFEGCQIGSCSFQGSKAGSVCVRVCVRSG